MRSPASLKLRHGTKKVEVRLNGSEQKAEVFPLENLGKNREFLSLIAGNEIQTIHSQEASLEEVFIKITGQQLL